MLPVGASALALVLVVLPRSGRRYFGTKRLQVLVQSSLVVSVELVESDN